MFDSARAHQLDHLLSKFEHAEFAGVTQVNRSCDIGRSVHQPNERLNQVVDIAERSGLSSVSEHGQRLPAQGLHNEARDNPAVVWSHAWAVRVEDPGYLDRHAVLAPVVKEQRFSATLALVITRA